jgi:uncharacterized protein YndB with AHSA1/START domain
MMATQEASSTDRIEKRVELRATRARVWRAISTASEFAAWFRVKLDGEFAVGKTVRGQITVPNYEHVKIEMQIQKIEAERYFAYRWHPACTDPKVDYAKEPTTLVEFTLEEAEGGCVLTIVESGFDKLPADRRAEAFRQNEGGWRGCVAAIEKYVA